MSTRSNIVIEKGGDVLYLYNHFDGYPDGVGAELLELADMLKKDMTPIDVYNSLVYLYGDDYEISKGLHGDIEYAYLIKLYNDHFEITFNKCARNNPMKYSDYTLESIKQHSFPYIDSRSNVTNTYTKGDLLGRKMRFTCDLVIDMKDSCVYGEMPYDMTINAGKLYEMLLKTHSGDIVKNTRIEIL